MFCFLYYNLYVLSLHNNLPNLRTREHLFFTILAILSAQPIFKVPDESTVGCCIREDTLYIYCLLYRPSFMPRSSLLSYRLSIFYLTSAWFFSSTAVRVSGLCFKIRQRERRPSAFQSDFRLYICFLYTFSCSRVPSARSRRSTLPPQWQAGQRYKKGTLS